MTTQYGLKKASVLLGLVTLFVILTLTKWTTTSIAIHTTTLPKPLIDAYKNNKTTLQPRVFNASSNPLLPRHQSNFQVTFDDPSTYKGPVVEGWPPEKNRSLEAYIRPFEDTFPMRPTSEAVKTCDLLIIVHTHPDYFESRMGIRNTYGQYIKDGLAGNTAIIFLIGQKLGEDSRNDSRNASRTSLMNIKLAQEQQFFGDILQADMQDSYNNLTLKTLFTLKYFLNSSNFASNYTGPKYLAKVDDDTYANLPRLWTTLYHDPFWSNITDLLMGSLFNQPKMLIPARGSPKNRHKKYTEKWDCPRYMFNGSNYPPMLSGSAYVMSRSAVSCLYSEALKLPFFHLEDVMVTGFAAEICGIERRHHAGFRHLPVTPLSKIKATDIMLHYRDLKGKIELHNSKILKS